MIAVAMRVICVPPLASSTVFCHVLGPTVRQAQRIDTNYNSIYNIQFVCAYIITSSFGTPKTRLSLYCLTFISLGAQHLLNQSQTHMD